MPVSQVGVASGIASTSRQIGQVLGIAVTGSILAANLNGAPLRTSFVPASHAAWLLLAACGGVVFVLGLVTTSRWALDTAARTAAAFDPAEPRTAVMTRLRVQPVAGRHPVGSIAGLRPEICDLPQSRQVRDRDVLLASADKTAVPPVPERAGHRGARRSGEAGQVLLRERHHDVDPALRDRPVRPPTRAGARRAAGPRWSAGACAASRRHRPSAASSPAGRRARLRVFESRNEENRSYLTIRACTASMACKVAVRCPVISPASSPTMSPLPRSASTLSWL